VCVCVCACVLHLATMSNTKIIWGR
jgi:hypothetical protein